MQEINLDKLKKKDVLKLPVRSWKDTTQKYDRILLVPDGTKHDSGYMHIAVIGIVNQENGKHMAEICAYPDDISAFFPKIESPEIALVRMDCFYPSGILQYHGRGKFHVSEALSSIDIRFIQ